MFAINMLYMSHDPDTPQRFVARFAKFVLSVSYFTVRNSYASAVLWILILSIHPSVSLSVTGWIKNQIL